ncbi:hypothetical protein CHGG_00892 [Chaetomium globosum CBS 148.51]|uniref:DUF3835 domain-containing protein n=1 Tax=Chaetomium globosum (strain ATCC 6205 / CBS 148.51 / DSM 1962 / NBRC 6347 / NRRL 1970) TaxID=306901 RepID=Q2HFW2_CHAGB|nr:uncharacterized protein CHGG_00892 [Chaetomium globosum CBS 148.51]EAQ92657.1 hypothetical protein CHGG_00892 [Chaetomium globosum CBS 148.51]
MTQPNDHLSDLDRHVQQLEGKVNQLRASLTHWQQWYLDYSALKEEVEQLPSDTPPHEQLRRIRRDFDSPRLTKKEINEIMGKHDLKAPEQIVHVLSRRLDYVEQNINTLSKSLETEENRLAAAAVVAHPNAGTDEESGLPFTDIIEELDEDDNVVNFRLQGGADAEPKISEALKKAGIQEEDLADAEAALSKTLGALGLDPKEDGTEKETAPGPTARASSTTKSTPDDKPVTRKKSVSFAEDTKSGDEVEAAQSKAAQDLERLMQKAKEQEAIDLSSAVIPDNESAEESKLRREMLEYGMSEIGPVVAELQLEEDYSGDEDDMDWIGSDDEFDDEETDDDAEDELGRSKRKVVTSDYMKRMQELEKRLARQSAFTVGGSETKPEKLDEGIGRIAVVSEPAPSTEPAPVPTPTESKGKKSVSFASKLDIAPDTARPDTGPIGDIVEKVAEEETLKDPEEPPKRVSRFKKDRPAVASSSHRPAGKLPPGPHQLPSNFSMGGFDRPTDPAPPEEIMAHTVAERPTIVTAEPDGLEDAALYEAAALEYSRLRNQLIRNQGGNVDDETGLVPLDEELGGPKRQSKFKAARLTKLQ